MLADRVKVPAVPPRPLEASSKSESIPVECHIKIPYFTPISHFDTSGSHQIWTLLRPKNKHLGFKIETPEMNM